MRLCVPQMEQYHRVIFPVVGWRACGMGCVAWWTVAFVMLACAQWPDLILGVRISGGSPALIPCHSLFHPFDGANSVGFDKENAKVELNL